MDRPCFKKLLRTVRPKENNSFVSGAPGDENESHAGGHKNNFFWNKCEEKYRRKFVILFFWVPIGLMDIELALYRHILLYDYSKRRKGEKFGLGCIKLKFKGVDVAG